MGLSCPAAFFALLAITPAIAGSSAAKSPSESANFFHPERRVFPSSSKGRAAGAALVGSTKWGFEGQFVRLTWRLKPAVGNCVVTTLSLLNSDKIFARKEGHWSEIAIDLWGGAASDRSKPQFQTQFVTYDKPNDGPAVPGRKHRLVHSEKVPKVFDGAFHDFQVEWSTARKGGPSPELIFRVDGVEIRHERGGDLERLEGYLEPHTAVWVVNPNNAWACFGEAKPPEASEAVLASLTAETLESGQEWVLADVQKFPNVASVNKSFVLADWGFPSFDGRYCPKNVRWSQAGQVRLLLTEQCPLP